MNIHKWYKKKMKLFRLRVKIDKLTLKYHKLYNIEFEFWSNIINRKKSTTIFWYISNIDNIFNKK